MVVTLRTVLLAGVVVVGLGVMGCPSAPHLSHQGTPGEEEHELPELPDPHSTDSGIPDGGTNPADAGSTPDAGAPDAGPPCVPGLCPSGACRNAFECAECTGDSQCPAERPVCDVAAGRCGECLPSVANACTAGKTCCNNRCVDTQRDDKNCGACNAACSSTQFCASTGCVAIAFKNVCAYPSVTVVLDGIRSDDDAGVTIAQGFATGCGSSVKTVTNPFDAGVLDDAGRPAAGPGELLVVPGGSYGQLAAEYIERKNLDPVESSGNADYETFVRRRDDIILVAALKTTLTASHDFFVVELVKEPISGTLVMQSYGLNAPGTLAGGWYVANQLLPMRATDDMRWRVVEWTDMNGDFAPDALDLFMVIAAEP